MRDLPDADLTYDPFIHGPHEVGVRTLQARDAVRARTFPCEAWYPQGADSATFPLVIFSHASGHHRRGSTFLCTHLASHGYIVAALDHSEVVAPELKARPGETEVERAARIQAIIASRVPDVRLLLDHMLSHWDAPARIDPRRIGISGHSFGGWTALAALDAEPRIGSVVALAPAGSSKRKAAILPATLDFRWGREVPALYLVAENDASLPLEGMREIFARAPSPKRMIMLRRADHAHFMDNVEETHEGFRTMASTPLLAEIQRDMLPIAELCTGEASHLFARGLAACHFDATLKGDKRARALLAGDIEAELAKRGIDARVERA